MTFFFCFEDYGSEFNEWLITRKWFHLDPRSVQITYRKSYFACQMEATVGCYDERKCPKSPWHPLTWLQHSLAQNPLKSCIKWLQNTSRKLHLVSWTTTIFVLVQWLKVSEIMFDIFLLMHIWQILPSVLWHCWLGARKSTRPVKKWVMGTGVVICLECGTNDLHMVQIMPPPPHHLLLQ